MRFPLFTPLALLGACSPSDTLLADNTRQLGFEPVAESFGYDPDAAGEVYGRELTFVNLDPRGFRASAEDEAAAQRALTTLLTYDPGHFQAPLWGRLLLDMGRATSSSTASASPRVRTGHSWTRSLPCRPKAAGRSTCHSRSA